MAVLRRFLTISVLAGLIPTILCNEHRLACETVGQLISDASDVYYPGDPSYASGKYHYTKSSEEDPACVVEPGTPEDVGKILNVIDATQTPFGVKSGGHTINRGFSSTEGILIVTRRFSQVTYDATSGTAVIGSGTVWDKVYEQLESYGITVVGGRVPGIGVGGFVLGGGYSFMTNEYGLAIDSVLGFNLVLPNGTVKYVTQSTHPDLFFGLKGGFNNFGIVTHVTMQTFPQAEVYGGKITYSSHQYEEVRSAIADFSENCQDPKAAILPTYISYAGHKIVLQFTFYNSPTPPPGTFDSFTNIPSIANDLKTRSYVDLITSSNPDSTTGFRGSWHMLGVTHFSKALLKTIEEELEYWTDELTPKSGIFFSYVPEPFLPNHLSHGNSPSAFPASAARQSDKAPNPLLAYFAWTDELYDDEFAAAVEESIRCLVAVARAGGLLFDDTPAMYGNYVNSGTPLSDIYGDNLPSLRELKARVDPSNIMGLAGGFKV